MIRVSAYLALAFAAFLAIGEVARNWGDWQWAPFWIVDYIAAGLLAFGSWRYFTQTGVRWLTGAWGFSAAMFYMSFFSHLENLRLTADGHTGPIEESRLTMIIGVLMVIVFVGFVLSLFGKR
ncbi:MAG: hypothetical protein AAFY34_05730 [Pseudomonadota bacterium]